jgi:sulfite reductase alpha subunit-like flavoprotein
MPHCRSSTYSRVALFNQKYGFALTCLVDQSLPSFLPHITTLRDILMRYVDITAVPKRGFFALARHFTTDEREREKMGDFVSSSEGAVRKIYL